jgi:hypothetical protein
MEGDVSLTNLTSLPQALSSSTHIQSTPSHLLLKKLTFHLRLGFPSDLFLHSCSYKTFASITRTEEFPL